MDLTMAEPGEILPDRKIDTSAYELLDTTTTSVEEIVSRILSAKKQQGVHEKSEIPELITRMFLNFINLRKANRSILLEEDLVKAETEHAKAPVDFTMLQLHNLMYEKNHYVKAIKACKDFKSKYPDIELVPEEEFFRDAPEEIKNAVQSKDSAQDLMLKRLNFELFQRKELCKLHEKLEEQKKALLETIGNRKKFLSSLPAHLKSLKKASLPVQNQLGILHTKKLKQHQSAELLPPPLYVIYSQLLAHKEAFGENIDLDIAGSMKDAHTFARQQANKETGMTSSLENSKPEDEPDEEDDGQRRRKRPKKIQGKDNLDPSRIFLAHPLKIILHVHDDEASDPKSAKLITLKFEYLVKFNVVCVGIEGSNEGPESNILCNLFPDDPGLEVPHQSAKLCGGDAVRFDEKRSMRPYKWAQHLAGIDFLPEVSPLLGSIEVTQNDTTKHAAVISGLSLYRQQNRVQTIVQRIRERKKAQLALADQLELLKNLKWPDLSCQTVPWASRTHLCSLHSWTIVSSPQASSLPATDMDQVQVSVDNERNGVTEIAKEGVREDGELPSMIPVTNVIHNVESTPAKEVGLDQARRLALISKSLLSPVSKGKSPSFRKQDDDLDLMLASDSEVDEPARMELVTENEPINGDLNLMDDSWLKCGVQEFCLVLLKKLDDEGDMKLEAKIKISAEYPLRPPLFALTISRASLGKAELETDAYEWFNELRAMEAEVNIHIVKMIPWDQENFILSHQVCCLAMLFDYYMDKGASSSGKRSTAVVDVGLCTPVGGKLMSRNFRGRDHRKIISWKDDGCAPGFPC